MITAGELVEALKTLPEFTPELLDIARQVVGEDGKLDTHKALAMATELENAISEATTYVTETRELVKCLKAIPRY